MNFDKWTVQQIKWTDALEEHVWKEMLKHPTIFTDSSRGRRDLWHSMVTSPLMFWLGVVKDNELIGIISLDRSDSFDVEVHLIFFDRQPAEKVDLCKMLMKMMFDFFPTMRRMTTSVPEAYRHTWRLAERIGFKHEGKKRSAVSIGGKWYNLHIFGILREEAYVILHRQEQGSGLDSSGPEGSQSRNGQPSHSGTQR